MIATLLKSSFRKFATRYDYDARYMSYVADTSTSAGLRLSLLSLYSQYSGGPKARNAAAGAALASTLDGDCGPCVQLVIDMAIEANVPADDLACCLKGCAEDAGDVGLGFRFSQAAISGGSDLDALRAEIEENFGRKALIAASFAASSGRVYPVLKRGLGFGQTCLDVKVADDRIMVGRQK